LTKEEKEIKKFPALTAKIDKLEEQVAKLKVEIINIRRKK
jgi:polyhydroxyalkanoate synthesis regulator phasin